MSSRALLPLALLALSGCSGELLGLEDNPTPLATIRVRVEGDLEPLRPPESLAETPRLRVALVWGQQWLSEPFCFLPFRSQEANAVAAVGCRDPYGVAPLRVAGSVAVEEGVEAKIELIDLPAADDMVGDLTGRIAYGSLVVFDDRNANGTLDLNRPARDLPGAGGDGPGDGNGPPGQASGDGPPDWIYGSSFLSMTRPDLRISYLEGNFDPNAAFYPRLGCPAPPRGFSVLGAGGFSAGEILEALLQGQLPREDPTTCSAGGLDETVVPVQLVPIDSVRDAGCSLGGGRDGSGGASGRAGITRYQELPGTAPQFEKLVWACAPIPDLGGLGGDGQGGGGGPPPASSGPQQLVIAIPSTDARPEDLGPVPLAPGDCKALVHYILRGCDDDALCETPTWDRTASVPDWWPCPLGSGTP